MTIIRTVTVIVSTVMLAACGTYFGPDIPDINLERYVTEGEVVGRWSLIPQTLEIAKRDGYAPAVATTHEITFREGGSCDFRSIVEFGKTATYFNTPCSWELKHDGSAFNKKKIKNTVFIQIKDRGIQLGLTEESGRLLLWDYWGDPDSWEFIKYEKS